MILTGTETLGDAKPGRVSSHPAPRSYTWDKQRKMAQASEPLHPRERPKRSSWIWPGPAQAFAALWGVNHLALSVALPNKIKL